MPRWYPNKQDIQLGTFIQKQALLLKEDFEIMVIYAQGVIGQKEKFVFEESTDNGIIERIIYFKQNTGPLKKIINAQRYKLAQKLGLKNTDFVPDLCHVHVPYRSAFLAIEHHRKGTPFVITEHWSGHINGEFDKKNAADKNIYKQVIGKAKNISTVSQLLRKKFKANTGFDSEVIPNLIEVAEEDPSSQQSNELIQLLTVSDLIDSTKNISGLLHAVKNTTEYKQVQLNIIGGGPDEQMLKALSQQLGLEKNVKFLGRLEHEDVLQHYSQCDFYVCNSNFETFGMAVAEALIAGKPVISTLCGGPNEYLHDKNSIQVHTKNIPELYAAILQMCEHYKDYDKEDIKAEITAKFGKDVIRKRWIEFYNNAINN